MNLIVRKIVLIIFLCLKGILFIDAQEQKQHPIKNFIDKNDKLYWNKQLPVYIRLSSSPEDKGIVMKSELTKQYANPYFFDTEGINRIRTRWATDQNTGKTIYPQMEVIWGVYADGIPPVSGLLFKNHKENSAQSIQCYGNDLKLEINATDATSGVEQIYYSINGEDYKLYNEALSINSEGDQKISFYAVDNVGNVEKPQEKKFTTDLSPPKTYYTITGISDGEIIAVNTKIYLSAEDSLSGVKNSYYKIDEGQYMLYRHGTNILIEKLNDGEHTLYFYSIDKVGNKEAEIVFPFYLDKTAPIIAADILGDKYLTDDNIFFSGRTKMKLTAIDNKSGVEDILFSVNGDKFNKYEQPFYLPSVPGIHIIKYFATDKMQNNSEAGSSKFEQYKHVVSRIYVDLTGPLLSYEIIGEKYKTRDTLFISKKTKIKFNALDKESGLKNISYSINSDPDEIIYSGPIQFDEPGLKNIIYYGYDNVNNRNRSDFALFVDNEGPDIKYNFSITSKGIKDEVPVYPNHIVLFLGATDQIVGAKDIYYSLNNSPEKKYLLSINGFNKASINTIKIRATDQLNNETFLELSFYVE